MSSQAQEVYQKLISESKATNILGVKGVAELSLADAAAVFQALSNKIRGTDNAVIRNVMVKNLCLMGEMRNELHSELLSFFKTFPSSYLSLAIVPQFMKAVKNSTSSSAINEVLSIWSKAENNPGLSKAAKQKLAK